MSDERNEPDLETHESAEGLPAAYQHALVEAVADLDIVTQLVNRNLVHEDIRRILEKLSSDDRDLFISTLAKLLRKTTALLLVSRRLSDSLSLDALLPRMVELTAEFLQAERCTVFLHDKATDELYTKAAVGLSGELRFPSHQGIAGAVFRSGQPLHIPDVRADPRFNPEIDKKTGFFTRDVLCVPIRSERDGVTEIVGVAEVLNKRVGRFTDEDLKLLDTLNTQAGAAFLNALLHEEVQKIRAEEGRLLELTAAMSTELQLQPLLVKIMETVSTLLEADRATLFMHDPRTGELWALVGQGEGLGKMRFPSHAGIAGRVFTAGETINIADAYADPRFNPELDQRTGYRTRSILCMPVINRSGEIIGVTQVLNKKHGPFTPIDERLLRGFSAQASIALDRAQLFEAFLEKQRIEESLRLAHDIQMTMVPRAFPERREFELFAELRPARSVGGDLYDFLIDGDRLWFLVADVSGKGVGAALFMAVTKTLFRATIQGRSSLSEVLSRVNRELCRDNERLLFVTVFAGCLDARTGEVVFGNAGHNLPYRFGGDRVSRVDGARGPAMGVFAEHVYETASLRLKPGEGLFLYTDGVTEALNTGGEDFSLARLESFLAEAAPTTAAEVVRGALAATEEFSKGTPQTDDISLLAVRFISP